MQTGTEDPVADAVAQLLESVQTLQLATLSTAGRPLASYTPYLHDPTRGFFIFVSELAAHTRNLQQCPEASVLIIADESATRQLFSRERLECECQAEFIGRGTTDWELYIERFEQKFGKVFNLIKDLQDFHLVALKPLAGTYVRGFGEAWSFEGAVLDHFSQVNSQSLTKSDRAATDAGANSS